MYVRNVRTIEGYLVVNFEIASSSSFPDIPNFLTTDLKGRRASMIALCETLNAGVSHNNSGLCGFISVVTINETLPN